MFTDNAKSVVEDVIGIRAQMGPNFVAFALLAKQPLLWHNVRMPEDDALKRRGDLARAVAASVLDRPIADVTDDTPLDSDDLDLVVVELSLAGIKSDRHDINTVGQLIIRLRP